MIGRTGLGRAGGSGRKHPSDPGEGGSLRATMSAPANPGRPGISCTRPRNHVMYFAQSGVRFQLDGVWDHAPVRLMSVAKTTPNTKRML